jgi:hypothetical protein
MCDEKYLFLGFLYKKKSTIMGKIAKSQMALVLPTSRYKETNS